MALNPLDRLPVAVGYNGVFDRHDHWLVAQPMTLPDNSFDFMKEATTEDTDTTEGG